MGAPASVANPARAAKRRLGVEVLPKGLPVSLVYSERTLKQMVGAGSIQCTVSETAAVLGVTKLTLERFWNDWPDARELWEKARETGKTSLRRKQIQVALKGNPQMLIWTGKQYLGQSDKQEVTATLTLESLILQSLNVERGSQSLNTPAEPEDVSEGLPEPVSEGLAAASEGRPALPARSEGLPGFPAGGDPPRRGWVFGKNPEKSAD